MEAIMSLVRARLLQLRSGDVSCVDLLQPVPSIEGEFRTMNGCINSGTVQSRRKSRPSPAVRFGASHFVLLCLGSLRHKIEMPSLYFIESMMFLT